MALPISGDNTGCHFQAFLRDENNRVQKAFARRVGMAESDDGLMIKLSDERSGMATYEITRSKTRNDMDSGERWTLALLTSGKLKSGNRGERIIITPEKYSWFAEAGQVSIKKGRLTGESVGTLMMVNPENVQLLKKNNPGTSDSCLSVLSSATRRLFAVCRAVAPTASCSPRDSDTADFESDDSIHQLIEMIATTGRQSCIYEHKINGLPKLVEKETLPGLIKGWPLLRGLGERYSAKKDALHGSVTKIVADMKTVVGTMVSMHDKQWAHGDIKLSNLRRVDGILGLAAPERFSVVGGQPGPDKLGEKRFTFYNNPWHAPELRFPGEVDDKYVWPEPECRFQSESLIKKTIFKPWQYTPVTKEGDIWSFGSLLAVMICRIPGGKALLEKERVLQLSLSDYMAASGQFNAGVFHEGCDKFLSDKRSLLELNLPKRERLPEQGDTAQLPGNAEKLSQLVALVKDCTDPAPEKRPSAESVYKRLGEIT